MFFFCGLTRAALRSSASANYMSIAATAAALKGPTTVRISFDYRNCGLTAAPPQLRGVSTATELRTQAPDGHLCCIRATIHLETIEIADFGTA